MNGLQRTVGIAHKYLHHQALHQVAVGRVEEIDGKKAMALEHGLGMRQLAKPFFTVVVAHA